MASMPDKTQTCFGKFNLLLQPASRGARSPRVFISSAPTNRIAKTQAKCGPFEKYTVSASMSQIGGPLLCWARYRPLSALKLLRITIDPPIYFDKRRIRLIGGRSRVGRESVDNKGFGYWTGLGIVLASAAIALLVSVTAVGPGVVHAFSHGITGRSGNPGTNEGTICTFCHRSGTIPTVTLGGPLSVAVGSTSTYRLTISGGQRSGGGLDVSVTGGTLLSGGADTRISAAPRDVIDGELVHSGTKAADGNGNVVFDFGWRAPPSAGSVTMYGAGNSVDRSIGVTGDNAASATLIITVLEAASISPQAFLPLLLRNSEGW